MHDIILAHKFVIWREFSHAWRTIHFTTDVCFNVAVNKTVELYYVYHEMVLQAHTNQLHKAAKIVNNYYFSVCAIYGSQTKDL